MKHKLFLSKKSGTNNEQNYQNWGKIIKYMC